MKTLIYRFLSHVFEWMLSKEEWIAVVSWKFGEKHMKRCANCASKIPKTTTNKYQYYLWTCFLWTWATFNCLINDLESIVKCWRSSRIFFYPGFHPYVFCLNLISSSLGLTFIDGYFPYFWWVIDAPLHIFFIS